MQNAISQRMDQLIFRTKFWEPDSGKCFKIFWLLCGPFWHHYLGRIILDFAVFRESAEEFE